MNRLTPGSPEFTERLAQHPKNAASIDDLAVGLMNLQHEGYADDLKTYWVTQEGTFSQMRRDTTDADYLVAEYVEDKEVLQQLGKKLSREFVDYQDAVTAVDQLKERGFSLSDEQETTMLAWTSDYHRGEHETYFERYIANTIQTDVVNTFVAGYHIAALKDQKKDQSLKESLRVISAANIEKLVSDLESKGVSEDVVDAARTKAENYLQKALDYYPFEAESPQEKAQQKRTRSFGQFISQKAGVIKEKVGNVAAKLKPEKKGFKQRTSTAVPAVLAGLAVAGVIAAAERGPSEASTDDSASVATLASEQSVPAVNTTSSPTTTIETTPLTTVETTIVTRPYGLPEISIPVQQPEVVETATTSTTSTSTTTPTTTSSTTTTTAPLESVQPRQATLLEAAMNGDLTLEQIKANRVGTLALPGVCLDDIHVYVAYSIDPVENPALVDGIDWSALNDDNPNTPEVTPGDLYGARSILNPLYRVELDLDTTPQEECEIEGQSDYNDRRARPTKGSAAAVALAANPSELQATATLHPHSSPNFAEGFQLIETHRTTYSAPGANLDALLLGQPAYFTDGYNNFAFEFTGFTEVAPDITIDEIRGIAGNQLVISTCEEGSTKRLLSFFRYVG